MLCTFLSFGESAYILISPTEEKTVLEGETFSKDILTWFFAVFQSLFSIGTASSKKTNTPSLPQIESHLEEA